MPVPRRSIAAIFVVRLAKSHYLFEATLFLTLVLLGPAKTPAAFAAPTIQSPASTAVLITELQYDPPGLDEEREWVELANLGPQPVLLAGYGLGDEENQSEGEGMLRFPEGSRIAAGEVIVIAQTASGFRTLFGFDPDYEIRDTVIAVPDMLIDSRWATGQFTLANDGDEILLLDERNALLDAVNYGDRTTFFTPGIPEIVSGQSIERAPAACDSDSAVDWRPRSEPAPGVIQQTGDCAIAPESTQGIEQDALPIGEIQGPGDVSARLNQIVTFRGVVTGLHQDQNASGVVFYTLFVQDVPGTEDGDPATSDAVAVFLGRQFPPFEPGDLIAVTGQVTEFFGLTEIDDAGLVTELVTSSQPLPSPQVIELPRDPAQSALYLEAREGMLVSAAGPRPVLGPSHAGCGFAVGSTPEAERPLRRSKDDGPAPVIIVLNQSDVDCSNLPALKTGDLVGGISGPLTFRFDRYKVVQQQTDALIVERAPDSPPPEPPAVSAAEFAIATFNFGDYLEPSSMGEDAGPGGVTAVNIEIKKRKLAYTISEALGCPELVGVQEVESRELLVELAESAAAACGFTYQVSHEESADSRGIDVALLSDPARVRVRGSRLHQTCSALDTGVTDSAIRCPPGEQPLFSRPPMEVMVELDGEPLAIFINHFKSKREGEAETAELRLAQAAHVQQLVQQRLDESAGDDAGDGAGAGIIVLGDFNDYELSPAWRRMQEGGTLYNAMRRAAPESRYTYIFDGESQLVDGILVSPALIDRIAVTAILHVNADFPASWAGDGSTAVLPFRSSDHDPALLVLRAAGRQQEAEAATATVAPTERSPEPAPDPTATIEDTPLPAAATESSASPRPAATITTGPTTETAEILEGDAAPTATPPASIEGRYPPNTLPIALLALGLAAVIYLAARRRF